MKCAMEMKMMVTEKIKEEERKRTERYLTVVLPKLNSIVEELLLSGNGIAEIMLDHKSNGEYYLCAKDYDSYPKNELPYWGLRRDKRFDYYDTIYLHHYISFLENLCYKVELTQKSFKGCSSTGKSTGYVYYDALIISIPKNPCQ